MITMLVILYIAGVPMAVGALFETLPKTSGFWSFILLAGILAWPLLAVLYIMLVLYELGCSIGRSIYNAYLLWL